MPIEITPELEQKLHVIFLSGKYESENHVLNEALTLLRQRDELRGKLQVGVEQLERGDRLSGDVVFSELRDQIDAAERQET